MSPRFRYLIGALGAAFVASFLLRRFKRGAFGIDYEVDPARPYGRSWKAERPPKLPASARHASVPGAAYPYVERIAGDQGLGPNFVKTMVALAKNESNGTFGLPARRPYASTSGWGTYQFNKGAWETMARYNSYYGCEGPFVPPTAPMMWDTTPYEELAFPIKIYACLWRAVKDAGGSDRYAASGVWLWHSGPAYFKSFLRIAKSDGFAVAWADTASGGGRREKVADRVVGKVDRSGVA